MNTVNLKINGKDVAAEKGQTVLAAARANGFEIPTLCNHEALAAFGACRLCIVEIGEGKRTKIVASCLYPVEEGLVVQTESEKVVKHRRMILELLRARWPKLPKALLEKYAVPEGRLAEEGTFCIMCGLCVRWCHEIVHADALGFVGRGTCRQVVVHEGPALKFCRDCAEKEGMACLNVCPTGVVVNDYALAPATMTPTGQKIRPIRVRDNDNIEEVQKLTGEKKR